MKSLILLFLFFTSVNTSFCTIRTITVSNYSFTPRNSTANVGDTVLWVWSSGSHTTTSSTIPAGAASWNSPMDATTTNFMYKITVAGSYSYICLPHYGEFNMGGTISVVTGILNISAGIPDAFLLHQNYPNPFNPVTRIKYEIPVSANVSLKIINSLGKNIAVLIDQFQPAGNYSVTFNAAELSSGIYFCKLESGEFIEIKRMLLLK